MNFSRIGNGFRMLTWEKLQLYNPPTNLSMRRKNHTARNPENSAVKAEGVVGGLSPADHASTNW
jgi:hypothetical protein